MPLAAGTRLDAYEILGLLGAGGMGEVYRARDSALKREVAIKVLPPFVSRDPDRLSRFEQEAQAAAALNHPNILAVHQFGSFDGSPYLVSELLEGSTLRQLLERGPLPVRKAIDYGVQIAHGLAAAHDKGIVHRDLKPENLFVTKDGHVKILDFGLAKLTYRERSPDGVEPTLTHETDPGMVMGTAGYMSPEQVRGQTVDHRTDIFAFGAILYEMLSGKRAFQRSTSAETMTAILNEEPPVLSHVGKDIPPGLERVVHRCLEKSPEQRFHSASDLAFALEALSDSGVSGKALAPQARRTSWRWLLAAIPLVLAVAAVIAWFKLSSATPFVKSITQITDDGEPKSWALSDGTRIYFTEGVPGAFHVVQVSASGGHTVPVENAPPDTMLAGLTSDGSQMFLAAENFDIFALTLPGGELRRLLDGRSIYDFGNLPDGRIMYSTRGSHEGSDLMIAERDGGNPRIIRSFKALVSIGQITADGRMLICLQHENGCTIQSIRTDGTDESTIMEWPLADNGGFGWSPGRKFLLFSRRAGSDSDLWALPLKSDLFQRSLRPVRLTSGPLSYTLPSASFDGKRIFTVGTKAKAEMVRFDPQTRQFLPWFPGLSAIEAHFSPDGRWMLYLTFPDLSIWRSRIDGTERMQLTFPPMTASYAHFSPDGKKIAFTSGDRTGYIVDVNGGQPQKITDECVGPEWSLDGKRLAFSAWNGKHSMIRLFDLENRKVSGLPNSEGILGALFVDLHQVIAFSFRTHKFVTYDFSTDKWSDVVSLPSASIGWHLSSDRKFLFYIVGGKELQVKRFDLANRKEETVAEVKGFHQAINLVSGNPDFDIAPDGALISSRDISSQEIYAMNIHWP